MQSQVLSATQPSLPILPRGRPSFACKYRFLRGRHPRHTTLDRYTEWRHDFAKNEFDLLLGRSITAVLPLPLVVLVSTRFSFTWREWPKCHHISLDQYVPGIVNQSLRWAIEVLLQETVPYLTTGAYGHSLSHRPGS